MASYGLCDTAGGPGYLRSVAGLAVRQDCPGGCCGVLFWKLTPCECSGGANNRWTTLYSPAMGCVWARIAGKCYTICPTAQSKETLGFGDVEVNPTLFPAASEAEGCLECCGTPEVTTCCELGGSCGLTSTAPPYSRLAWTCQIAELYGEGRCSDCTRWSVSRFDGANWAGAQDFPVGPCTDETSKTEITPKVRTHPCSGTPTDEQELRSIEAAYDLVQGPNREYTSPIPPGTSDGNGICIGTAERVPTPAVWARYDYGAPFSAHFTVTAAVSITDPSKWWLYVTEARVDPDAVWTLSGSVAGPGNCTGRLEASFAASVAQIAGEGSFCGEYTYTRRTSGTFVVTMSNIGPCGGASPPPDPSPTPTRDPNRAAIEAALETDPMHLCKGCGG